MKLDSVKAAFGICDSGNDMSRRFRDTTQPFCNLVDAVAMAAPDVPHQIYKGMLTKQVKAVKTFSFGTSLIGIGMQPILYEHISAPESSLPLMVALYSAVGIFTFVTPFLIHFVTKKYVTDIMFDPATEQYQASAYKFFPIKRKITFKLEDITVPDVPGAFTTLCVKNIPLLCSPSDFLYPKHYIKFMGYDKPVDYQLSTPKEQNKDNTKS
uniref:EOG090X0CKL n=1 Tax=Daphnia lumholtzi TaxID=42856 RepID=A0A4Y7MEL6_9CRUS|nr:EOG090X0CKL [Daphnia lumholtzi]SVE79100.1 EOG090X0CKL [Daphnia lumholtzi]